MKAGVLVLLLLTGACTSEGRPPPRTASPDPVTAPTTTGSATPTADPSTAGPTPPTPTPTPTARPRTFTVIAAGDILLHSLLWRQGARDSARPGGYDFRPLLASIRPAVSRADLAICHIESPFGAPNGPFTNYPSFAVPPQIAAAVAKTGYDSCSTASNHSLDTGEAGVRRTLDALDRAGVRHAGTARSAREARTPTLLRVRGVTVAHLSYSFGFNGVRRPRGREWLANLLDPDAVLADAKRARAAGAEVVIVSLHWGTEYSHTPDDRQRSIARRLLASADIDLILGHHAHVVQPLQRIGGKWVAYGMGNEVAYQDFSHDTRDGIMPRFTFTEARPGVFRVTKAEALPIHMWLDGRPVRLYDVASAVDDPRLPAAVKESCRASRRRTVAVLGRLGAYRDGLTVVGHT